MGKELLVGKTSEFEDGGKKIIPNGKSEIGVYLIKGEWFAYQNLCPHQGGPACEGLLMAKVEEIIDPEKRPTMGCVSIMMKCTLCVLGMVGSFGWKMALLVETLRGNLGNMMWKRGRGLCPRPIRVFLIQGRPIFHRRRGNSAHP